MNMDGRKAKSRKIVTSTRAQWIDLPGDLTANILQRLGAVEILESAQKVCTNLLGSRHVGIIHMRLTRKKFEERMSIMCRRAVDLSHGQLLDLSIYYFGDDDMLNYILQRSCQLKRLTRHCCNLISVKGLAEAAKKLANFEELHLPVTELVQVSDIETIGISCPKLKSFTLKQHGRILDENVYALAVAKNMPNLCHLRLLSQRMSNEGLEAILDGCPNLESLDIRQCFALDLGHCFALDLRHFFGAALVKRCCELIKDTKFHNDSTNDDEWRNLDFHCEYF